MRPEVAKRKRVGGGTANQALWQRTARVRASKGKTADMSPLLLFDDSSWVRISKNGFSDTHYRIFRWLWDGYCGGILFGFFAAVILLSFEVSSAGAALPWTSKNIGLYLSSVSLMAVLFALTYALPTWQDRNRHDLRAGPSALCDSSFDIRI
jgi:hypothetical protein